jgi:arylsulfatase A-like enzyme
MFLKGVAPFEEAYKVPLVLRGPGIAPGTVVEEPTSLLDLGRTLTSLLLGEDFGGHGRDLSDVLAPDATHGAATRGPSQAFAEFHGQRFGYTQRIIWRGRYKYVFNGFDRDELYDLAADPHELVNLAGLPEHGRTLTAMATAMWREVRRTGDDTLGDAQYGMFRFAPVGPESASRQGEDRDD